MENGQEIMKEETEDVKMEQHPETAEECEVFIKEKIEEDTNELDSLSKNLDEINKNKCEAFVRKTIEEVKEENESLTENPVSITKEECQVFINEERQVFINEERLEAVVPSQRAALPCSEEDPLVR
jgi:hypothetical protein